MKLLWAILKTMGVVMGFAATYGTLVADAEGWDVWGLAWQYWAMIGFTIFWISLGAVIWQQHLAIRSLRGADKELEREAKRTQIKKNKMDIKLTKSMYGEIDLEE